VTARFLTDEHVPRVFVTSLRSNGHDVVRANDAFGEATDDETLLRHCAKRDRLLITNDKKDFSGAIGGRVDHSGVVIYTDPLFLRDNPEAAVRVLDRVLAHYPPEELAGETVWLDQWRK
jgi:hypothetical protein